MPEILDFKAKSQQPFTIRAAKDKKSAEIIIYSPIGASFWGEAISAKQFSDELKKLDAGIEELHVRINSPGGDCFDGITIYNRLRQHKAKKIVYIDGLAASIASIIALAGDEIIIGEGALYMIHLPWTWAMGNRMEFDNTINLLSDIEEQMIGIYAKRSGMDRSEIRKLLEAETWMDADEAIDKGFVDKKAEESLPIAASAMEQKWIMRAPKKYNSEEEAIKNSIEELKKKIGDRIARK